MRHLDLEAKSPLYTQFTEISGVATILVFFALCVRGTTSQNAIGLALLNVMQFGDSTRNVIDYWVSLETSLGATARLRAFAQEAPTERDSSTGLPPGCLTQGAIELIGVISTYK